MRTIKVLTLLEHKMFKDIFVLVTGTAGSQLIGILFIPIITRFYGPDAYGILGVFIACLGVLIPLSTLGFPGAIVLPKKDNIAIELARISLFISFCTCTMVFLIVLFFGDNVFSNVSDGRLLPYMYFIPIAMLLSGLLEILHQMLIRWGGYKSISLVSVMHALLNYGGQALYGIFNPVVKSLLIVYIVSIIFRVLSLSCIIKRSISSDVEYKPSTSLKEIMYEYNEFPLYRTPQMVINALSQSLPVILLSSLFSPAAAGYYALTRTILNVPIRLLGNSIQNVFYPNFNKLVLNDECCSGLLVNTVKVLSVIGFFPFLVVVIFGPEIFKFVFGNGWGMSGEFAQWLSLWLYFVLITRPVVAAISVLRLQRWYLIYEILSVFIRICVFIIASYYNLDALSVVAAFSLSEVALHVALILKVYFSSVTFDENNRTLHKV